jgi:site-specific DNA-cytosine methylase
MGYKLAGCDVLGCLDIDKVQLMLYKDNLKPKYAFCDDIKITTFGFNISTPLIASKNKSSSTCSACPSLNFFFFPLLSSAVIFAPECGYKVSLQKLFSEDFGVPQKRHRAFFFAVRDDIGCKVDLANSPVFHFNKASAK